MKRRHTLPAVAVAAAVSLVLVSGAVASRNAPARGEVATITVTLADFSIKLSAKTAPVGKVTFAVRNGGKASHNFAIAGKKTSVLGAGKSTKLVVTFTKAGPFAYSSTVAGDAKKGMKGTFTLKTGPAAGGGTIHVGQELFASTGCGACHTFKAAGTTGSLGPNLDRSSASRAQIVGVITAGKGVMQAYAGSLTTDEIQDVADFLFTSRGG